MIKLPVQAVLRAVTPTLAALSAAGVAISLSACSPSHSSPEASPSSACKSLDESLNWYGDNRQTLQRVIDAHSSCQGEAPSEAKPFAVFDFDNTLVKNDITDALNYWMIRNDKIQAPENHDWRTRDKFLTDDAAALLDTKCGTQTPPGQPLPTSTNTACADEILNLINGKTSTGVTPFEGANERRMEPAYVWAASLLTGYSRTEVIDMVKQSRQENLSAPVGAMQTVGTQQVNGYVRYYDQMKDLIATLKSNGIDVYIMSASPETSVDVWADELGVAPDHAYGTRYIYDHNDIFTPHVAACGDAPQDSVIPYIDGKRCWINQEILGIQGSAAFDQAHNRQMLAGGDSTTDLTFVSDATEAHLVINRNSGELMCNAYFDADGKWVINPMFIDPKPQMSGEYQCATAHTNPDGTKSPAQAADGKVIPDQHDTVY